MKYEFGNAVWLDEDAEGGISSQSIEKMHQDIENKIRTSIEALIESRENFLGEGKTAEVHFLENNEKLCYKIIRNVDVMARPDSVGNLPPKYREIYDKKKSAEEKARSARSLSETKEMDATWHVDLFTEASYLSRARQIDPEGPVKIPRPMAVLKIDGKQEGEGFEVDDNLEVLLMDTMDAVSVDDLTRKGELPPKSFEFERFWRQLQDFVAKMHEDKLYHRDMHGGNVMIDRATENPVVIDFGRSSVSTEEEAYIEEIKPGMKMHFIRDEQMLRDKVKAPLTEYLKYQNLTDPNK